MKPLKYEVIVERTTFKDKPTLTFKIGENDKYPFSLGTIRLKAILLKASVVREFIEDVEGE
jgi:hypothetical protein